MNPYDMPTRLVEIKGRRRRAPLDCYSFDCTIVDTVGVPFHRHPSRSRLRMHQAPPSLLLATIVTTAAIAMLLFTSTIHNNSISRRGWHQVDFKLGGLCSSPLKGPTLGPTLRPRAREKGRP